MKRLILATTILSCVLGVVSARAADNCTLTLVATLPLTALPDGRFTVPVKIAGTDQKMLLALNEAGSGVLAAYADTLKLQSKRIPSNVTMYKYGARVEQEVSLPEIQFGSVRGNDLWVLKLPTISLADGPVGILALDLLSQSDVEINLAGSVLNLFSPHHCPGAGVYWGQSYAATPFETDALGHLSFKMQLDGKPLSVDLLPEAPHAIMEMATAKRLFDLRPGSPGMVLMPAKTYGFPAYRYQFKTLSAEGVVIGNPSIDILDDGARAICDGTRHIINFICYGRAQLQLGSAELRRLRLYLSFRDKMLYITAAEPASRPAPVHFPVALHCTSPEADEYFTSDGPAGSITARVNFAINSSGPAGAIQVAPGKDGICTIRADKGISIASATLSIANSDSSPARDELLKHLEITEQGSGDGDARVYTLRVKATDATAGTITLDLPVRYH